MKHDLKLVKGGQFSYSEGIGGTPCFKTVSGTWSVTYTANRTGQDIVLSLRDNNNNVTQYHLSYSKENDTFYYLDKDKGLLALKRERQLKWVKTGLRDPAPHFKRKGMISIQHKDLVCFGLGQDVNGEIYYNDWWTFNGSEFVSSTSMPKGTLPFLDSAPSFARATLKGDDIYITGGYNSISGDSSTYIFDTKNKNWSINKKGNPTGYDDKVCGRSNGIYFTLGGLEVMGLGYVSSSGLNIYSRTALNSAWNEEIVSGLTYGTEAGYYQNALSFPWNGGQFIGGGMGEAGMTDFMCHATNNGGLEIKQIAPGVLVNPVNSKFSEGAAIALGDFTLVYGLNTPSGYSDSIYVLERNNKWSKYLPTPTDLGEKPAHGQSAVLWKVFNKITNKIEVYAGFGENEEYLYQLVIE